MRGTVLTPPCTTTRLSAAIQGRSHERAPRCVRKSASASRALIAMPPLQGRSDRFRQGSTASVSIPLTESNAINAGFTRFATQAARSTLPHNDGKLSIHWRMHAALVLAKQGQGPDALLARRNKDGLPLAYHCSFRHFSEDGGGAKEHTRAPTKAFQTRSTQQRPILPIRRPLIALSTGIPLKQTRQGAHFPPFFSFPSLPI